MNWRKVLSWEEAESNYKLYIVPVSGNEYWPKGGIFFKGTISQIASKLADKGLADDELAGEQLISNLIASAPDRYNLHVIADNDCEHYALGPEFTPNSSLIVSVMEEWGNEAEEDEK